MDIIDYFNKQIKKLNSRDITVLDQNFFDGEKLS